MSQFIPGKGLQFYVGAATPYNVRIRFGGVGNTVNPPGGTNAQFDWQIDVAAADWIALIAAITAAIGTAGASYNLPNATYPNDAPKYAGSLASNDFAS